MRDYVDRETVAHNVLMALNTNGEVMNAIYNTPAADVEPVKRGRWVKTDKAVGWFTPGGDPVWECSECGKGMHVYGIEHGTYGSDVADGQWVACPNCGARMDGDADGI